MGENSGSLGTARIDGGLVGSTNTLDNPVNLLSGQSFNLISGQQSQQQATSSLSVQQPQLPTTVQQVIAAGHAFIEISPSLQPGCMNIASSPLVLQQQQQQQFVGSNLHQQQDIALSSVSGISNNNSLTAINHHQLATSFNSSTPPPQQSSQHLQNIANSSNQVANMNNSADYLAQLLKDKKQLAAFPNVFGHLERLLDEEVSRVRANLFHISGCEKKPLILPEPDGQVAQRSEKVYVPSKEFPEYNFVGRILGPRGMTAKQLEQETGCKIMVRGRGSMRDKKKEDSNRGKPNWEHLNDELHVLITVDDTPNRAQVKIARAIDEVRKLLVPVTEGEDELKKRQLMELAIINGTYRDSNTRNNAECDAAARMLHSPISHLQSMGRATHNAASMGAPLIISPARHHLLSQHMMNGNGPPPLIPADGSGLLYAPFDAYHHHYAMAAQQHLMEAHYPNTTNHGMTSASDNSLGGPCKKKLRANTYSPTVPEANLSNKRPREI